MLEGDGTVVLTRPGEENKTVYCGAGFALEERQKKEEGGRPFLGRRRHTASAVSLEDFGERLRALAYQMGLRRAREVAFIAAFLAGLVAAGRRAAARRDAVHSGLLACLRAFGGLGQSALRRGRCPRGAGALARGAAGEPAG